MRVIKAGINELESVAKLFDHYRIFYKQESDPVSCKKFIQERMKNHESIIFMAVEDGNPLGFVQLYPSFSSVSMKRLWILNDLFVEMSARKNGVGRALMDKAKEYAGQTGSKGLILETDRDNDKAQRLYESLGYEKDVKGYHYRLWL
ncbi:MAG TPA: GNAT family N-acetyltransferase [Bacillales bacterium]|nr:GNAT family N-acetyltransferase [Bacillales bacterium]